jgi:hypothetical protein
MAFEEYKSQGTVNAEQLEEARSVITPQGAVTGQAGQWEVRYPDGDVRVLDDEAFQEQWGGESGESEGEETEESASQRTQRNAGAETISPVTTAGADSESDSSPDSDRAHTSSDTDSDTDSDKESDSKTRAEKTTTEKETDSPV